MSQLPYPVSARILGYQQVSSGLGSPVPLTVPPGAKVAYVEVGAAAVRWRDDGVAPTATVGMPVAAGDALVYNAGLTAIRFIAQGGSPVLDVSYYG